MNWYRFRTVKSSYITALHHVPRKRRRELLRRTNQLQLEPEFEAEAGAPPTCRQRQYVDRGRRR
eukprot:1199978-Prymnesium_polylepis.1